MKSPIPLIILHIMTQAWPFHINFFFPHILQNMVCDHKIGHALWKTLYNFLIRLLLLSATSICSFLFLSLIVFLHKNELFLHHLLYGGIY